MIILLLMKSVGSPPQTPMEGREYPTTVISLEAVPAQSSHLHSVTTELLGKSKH